MGIPVLFIRGTKGSGKTKFIEESLINGDFGDVGKALVLKLENGEEEYDEAKLSGKNAFVSSILNPPFYFVSMTRRKCLFNVSKLYFLRICASFEIISEGN